MAKKKKATKAAPKKAAKGKDMLVVASKVKGVIRGKGMMCSADAVAALSDCVYGILETAMKRAEANRRSTVRPQDL